MRMGVQVKNGGGWGWGERVEGEHEFYVYTIGQPTVYIVDCAAACAVDTVLAPRQKHLFSPCRRKIPRIHGRHVSSIHSSTRVSA